MTQFIVEYRFKNGVKESFLLGEQALDRMDFAWLFHSSLFEIENVVIRRASASEVREHQRGAMSPRLVAGASE